METETNTQAGATTVPAWLLPDRFTAWCHMCAEQTESDHIGSGWCGKCGTRREQ